MTIFRGYETGTLYWRIEGVSGAALVLTANPDKTSFLPGRVHPGNPQGEPVSDDEVPDEAWAILAKWRLTH